MLLSRHQNAGYEQDIKTAKRSTENAAKVEHLGARVTDTNLIHEKIKSILNLDNLFRALQPLWTLAALSVY
jgi:hypothetical protein